MLVRSNLGCKGGPHSGPYMWTMPDLPRVAFVSLGCAKNLVDSEKMLGQLAEAGCAITSDEDDADVIVINTCGKERSPRQNRPPYWRR